MQVPDQDRRFVTDVNYPRGPFSAGAFAASHPDLPRLVTRPGGGEEREAFCDCVPLHAQYTFEVYIGDMICVLLSKSLVNVKKKGIVVWFSW